MFPDAESLEDFLSQGSIETLLHRDEIEEILAIDIELSSESELLYLNTKTQALIDNANRNGEPVREFEELQTRIQNRL